MNIHLPIWSWPFILALVVFIGCFLGSKNYKTSCFFGLKAFLLGIACLVIIEFEYYLDNTFVGSYNELGQAAHFSHSGWRLMIDAWPLWVAPLFIFTLLKLLSVWIYVQFKGPLLKSMPQIKSHPMKDSAVPSDNNGNKMQFRQSMQEQLATQEIKQKLDIAINKYEEIKRERYQYQTKIRQLELAISKAGKNGGGNSENTDELKSILDEQNQEINEANELIEHLLQQLYESKANTEDEDDSD